MGIIRPATPGFLCTLIATILLAVVSFCVPWFKSVFFLKASLTVENVNGNITFGTLGYCLELATGTTCSNASVGYELNINQLVGNNLPIQIPQVVVKWLTYALVLHIVALGLAAASAVFGLLAHVREMAMTCCSSCISGLAAAVALVAFIFDIAFFFVIKARLNDVAGGSATIGNAIWLTLVAWILLFLSGCFYTLGRCCIKRRPRTEEWQKSRPPPANAPYPDRMQLDAVKAEADRKAMQKQVEGGLPAFAESQPLTARVDGDAVYADDEDPYHDNYNPPAAAAAGRAAGYGRRPSQTRYNNGYAQAPPGNRAVDEYYNPTQNQGYPPQRQPSNHTLASNYAPPAPAPTNYGYAPPTSPPPANNQYLVPGVYAPDRYTSSSANDYGHAAGGTSYHTAASHQQYPTNYSQADPYGGYEPQPQQHQPQQYLGVGNRAASPPSVYTASTQSYYSDPPTNSQPERAYTLGGDGYGGNVLPPLHESTANHNAAYMPSSYGITRSPEPIYTSGPTSPIRGPRSPRSPTSPTQHYNDMPPSYESNPAPRPA